MGGINRRADSRHSLRLPLWDYSKPGAYFVTLAVNQQDPLFGEIREGNMRCNRAGEIVWETWRSLPRRYPTINLDEAVVMPDHFHGIVVIKPDVSFSPVAKIHEFSPQGTYESARLVRRRMLLPLVIGYFKMNSAKRINLLLGNPGGRVWERNYYERIIRNERMLAWVRAYILANPGKWVLEKKDC